MIVMDISLSINHMVLSKYMIIVIILSCVTQFLYLSSLLFINFTYRSYGFGRSSAYIINQHFIHKTYLILIGNGIILYGWETQESTINILIIILKMVLYIVYIQTLYWIFINIEIMALINQLIINIMTINLSIVLYNLLHLNWILIPS